MGLTYLQEMYDLKFVLIRLKQIEKEKIYLEKLKDLLIEDKDYEEIEKEIGHYP